MFPIPVPWIPWIPWPPMASQEPSVQTAVTILRGLKERYAAHHGVSILDAALVAAATLSVPWISLDC